MSDFYIPPPRKLRPGQDLWRLAPHVIPAQPHTAWHKVSINAAVESGFPDHLSSERPLGVTRGIDLYSHRLYRDSKVLCPAQLTCLCKSDVLHLHCSPPFSYLPKPLPPPTWLGLKNLFPTIPPTHQKTHSISDPIRN